METSAYYLWQLGVAAVGVAAVIGYVIYTALLYKSYQNNLKEVREANERHDAEFKLSMRPWLGFKDVTTNLSDETSMLHFECYVMNFGQTPALESEIYYFHSDRPDVFFGLEPIFSQFSLLPSDQKQLIIKRKSDRVRTDNRSPVYLLVVARYKSAFGWHWSRERIKVEVGKNKCKLELFEVGDESPPSVETCRPGRSFVLPAAAPQKDAPVVP